MIDIDKIIKQISTNTGIDVEIVDAVCKHAFKCTVEIMKDPNDYHEILFNKLFKFKLKNRFKDNKTKNYSPND